MTLQGMEDVAEAAQAEQTATADAGDEADANEEAGDGDGEPDLYSGDQVAD